MEVLQFKNIEEIKFTKVGENTFSMSIKSDMLSKNGNFAKDTAFESQICTIDSSLHLSCNDEYTNYDIGGRKSMGKCYSIPMNVNLLVDEKTGNIYTIRKEEENE